MNINSDTNTLTDDNVMKAIHNISEQLTYIKSAYDKKTKNNFDENSSQFEEINGSIQNLVNGIQEKNIEIEKEILVENLVSDVKENDTLLISEKKNKVFLPYTINDLNAYLKEYPEEYKSLSDVINQEYIVSLKKFKNQTVARFRETYCLMRDIEMKSIIESFKKAVETMFKSNLNPVVISACKTEEQLNNYIYCVEHNCLDEFKDFKIVFDISPLKNKYQNNFENIYMKKNKKSKGKHY